MGDKLRSARQASRYLKDKAESTEVWESDPRVLRFFTLIDHELAAAESMMGARELALRIVPIRESMRSTRDLVDHGSQGAPAATSAGVLLIDAEQSS